VAADFGCPKTSGEGEGKPGRNGVLNNNKKKLRGGGKLNSGAEGNAAQGCRGAKSEPLAVRQNDDPSFRRNSGTKKLEVRGRRTQSGLSKSSAKAKKGIQDLSRGYAKEGTSPQDRRTD